MKRLIRFLLILPVLTGMTLTAVRANSAMTVWQGTDAYGVVVQDEDCPLEVLHEDLVFSLPEQPDPFKGMSSPEEYRNSVTAEYTFYNPSEYHVEALLSFPIGKIPMYVQFEDEPAADELYHVSVNGKPAELRRRITAARSEDFSISEDLSRLSDEYMEDALLRPDLPVTEYVYHFDNVEYPSGGESAVAVCSFENDPAKTIVGFEWINQLKNEEDHTDVGIWVENGDDIHVYVIGEKLLDMTWHTILKPESTEYSGSEITLVSERETTLLDFIKDRNKRGTDYSDTDLYNVYVGYLNRYDRNQRVHDSYALPGSEEVIYWFQYVLEADPGETVINSVTVPVYPQFNGNFDPPVSRYTYLLSPASTWKSFGDLDVEIQSSLFISEESLSGFTKEEDVYKAHFDSLPESELQFSLCESAAPAKKAAPGMAWLILAFIAIPFILGAFVILMFIRAVIRKITGRS